LGYTRILLKQKKGQFLCKRLEVQFSDSYIDKLPLFSGYYKLDETLKADDRQIYRSEVDEIAFFRYCNKNEAFIFNYIAGAYDSDNLTDIIKSNKICDVDYFDHYLMQSATTKGYNILDTNPLDWLTRNINYNNFLYPVDYFTLKCADCKPETCNGVCGSNDENECICNKTKDGYGRRCQLTNKPCNLIQVDSQTSKFDSYTLPFEKTAIDISSSFKILRSSEGDIAYTYARPMYGFDYKNGYMDILVYEGRRYYLFNLHYNNINISDSSNAMTEIADLVIQLGDIDFYKTFIKLSNVYYMSDPIDVYTPSDRIDPVGLNWYNVDKKRNDFAHFDNWYKFDKKGDEFWSEGTQIDTVLVCAECDYDKDHGFYCPIDYGNCTKNKICESYYD